MEKHLNPVLNLAAEACCWFELLLFEYLFISFSLNLVQQKKLHSLTFIIIIVIILIIGIAAANNADTILVQLSACPPESLSLFSSQSSFRPAPICSAD